MTRNDYRKMYEVRIENMQDKPSTTELMVLMYVQARAFSIEYCYERYKALWRRAVIEACTRKVQRKITK